MRHRGTLTPTDLRPQSSRRFEVVYEKNASRYGVDRSIQTNQSAMAKKPAGLIYGIDDKPPLSTSVLLGIQHVFVMKSGWVMVVIIVTTIGGTQEEVANVLRISMIASVQPVLRAPRPYIILIGCAVFQPASGRRIQIVITAHTPTRGSNRLQSFRQ